MIQLLSFLNVLSHKLNREPNTTYFMEEVFKNETVKKTRYHQHGISKALAFLINCQMLVMLLFVPLSGADKSRTCNTLILENDCCLCFLQNTFSVKRSTSWATAPYCVFIILSKYISFLSSSVLFPWHYWLYHISEICQ